MLLEITPLPAPRINYKATWTPRAQRYYAYCNELRALYKQDLPARVSIAFYLPMPKSWSAKKRELMDGRPHANRPDADNLLKGVMDSLARKNSSGKREDGYIWNIQIAKYWNTIGGISIKELER